MLSRDALRRLALSLPDLPEAELAEQARVVADQSAEMDRLAERLAAIRRQLARGSEPEPVAEALEQERRTLGRRLEAIMALAAPGYALPRAAGQLVSRAREYGWLSRVVWTSVRNGHVDEPFVTVGLARVLTEAEQDSGAYRGDRWRYRLTWHSCDCPVGRLRLFSSLAWTPDHPGWGPGPSLKAVRAVMSAHPAPSVVPRGSGASA